MLDVTIIQGNETEPSIENRINTFLSRNKNLKINSVDFSVVEKTFKPSKLQTTTIGVEALTIFYDNDPRDIGSPLKEKQCKILMGCKEDDDVEKRGSVEDQYRLFIEANPDISILDAQCASISIPMNIALSASTSVIYNYIFIMYSVDKLREKQRIESEEKAKNAVVQEVTI